MAGRELGLCTAHVPQVDAYVARQQRRQLGLCEECGGLFEPGSCAEKSCPARRLQ